jgi:hypothetical protein
MIVSAVSKSSWKLLILSAWVPIFFVRDSAVVLQKKKEHWKMQERNETRAIKILRVVFLSWWSTLENLSLIWFFMPGGGCQTHVSYIQLDMDQKSEENWKWDS